ncbi:MAG: winged helix family transcriptional regulator [Acidobacteria bacterium]|nr:MAG: winged helix family transcriptional regulator [Acidobacteriota bacterium]
MDQPTPPGARGVRPRKPLTPSQAALRTRPFMIGDWLVEPLNGVLRHRDGRRLEVEGDDMMVLVTLATSAGQLTPRRELLEAVWPEAEDDEPLEAAIARLRQRLGDDPQAPRVIEAVEDRGYRLVARVKLLASDSGRWRVHPDTGELISIDEPATRHRPWWPWLLAAALALLLLALVALRLTHPQPETQGGGELGGEVGQPVLPPFGAEGAGGRAAAGVVEDQLEVQSALAGRARGEVGAGGHVVDPQAPA